MATRSLLLSLTVTIFLAYSFTVGLTDPDSFVNKLPDWLSIPLLLGCCLLYLLATWWAFKGFGEHKLMALLSLGLCTFGLGVYAVGFSMELGSGKAAPGQYEYDFTKLAPAEKAILMQIARDAGIQLADVVFTEHWHVAESTDSVATAANPATKRLHGGRVHGGFRFCVQKGHITALNVSNHPVKNLALFSQLPDLGDLYLKNCGLSDMNGLQLPKLDRLDVSDNQLTTLKTLRGCPNIRWLFAQNNRLEATDGLEQFTQLVSTDFTGNPLP